MTFHSYIINASFNNKHLPIAYNKIQVDQVNYYAKMRLDNGEYFNFMAEEDHILKDFNNSLQKYIPDYGTSFHTLEQILQTIHDYIEEYTDLVNINAISWKVKLDDGFDASLRILAQNKDGKYVTQKLFIETTTFAIKIINII